MFMGVNVSFFILFYIFIDRLHVYLDIFVIFLFLFFYMFSGYPANWVYFSAVIVPWMRTVWVTAYVWTKEIYRLQRESNPVPSGSESTTPPMSYPGAIVS